MADYEFPDAYFGWIFECYTLLQGGYTIENNRISLTEWQDIGILRGLLETRDENQRLSNLSAEMTNVMVALLRRR